MRKIIGIFLTAFLFFLISNKEVWAYCSIKNPPQVSDKDGFKLEIIDAKSGLTYDLTVNKDGNQVGNTLEKEASSNKVEFSLGPYPVGTYSFGVRGKDSSGSYQDACFPTNPTKVLPKQAKYQGTGCNTSRAQCTLNNNGSYNSLLECQTKCPNTQYPTSITTCDPCGLCPLTSPPPDYDKCKACIIDKTTLGGSPGAYTALGCLPTDPSAFVAWLLKAVIGIAGGIVFLLILYGGFQIMTSTGDPEKLNNGKEIIVSAIAGLLMIVFSVILLRIIGVDILRIPGFDKP